MTARLIYENLIHRPLRSLLSTALIGVIVTLILTLVGLGHGMVDDSAKRAQGVGADVMVRPPGSSLLSFSGAPIPEALVRRLEQVPHVTVATGTVNYVVTGLTSVTGIDEKTFNAMSGGFVYLEGHSFQRPDDIVLDTFYAKQQNVHAGGTVTMLNRPWHVAGIIAPGKLAHIVLPIKVLQDLTATTGKVSQIYLKVDNAKNIQPVITQLKSMLTDYPVYPMEELVSLLSVNNVPMLRAFIDVVMWVGVIVGFAVVCLSMYMAVLQRTREIGILKSLGASKAFIMKIILAEAAMLGIGGTVIGILLSYGTKWLLANVVPASLPQAIVPEWWPIAGMVALGAALLGALYPGIKAARQDPIEALAYE